MFDLDKVTPKVTVTQESVPLTPVGAPKEGASMHPDQIPMAPGETPIERSKGKPLALTGLETPHLADPSAESTCDFVADKNAAKAAAESRDAAIDAKPQLDLVDERAIAKRAVELGEKSKLETPLIGKALEVKKDASAFDRQSIASGLDQRLKPIPVEAKANSAVPSRESSFMGYQIKVVVAPDPFAEKQVAPDVLHAVSDRVSRLASGEFRCEKCRFIGGQSDVIKHVCLTLSVCRDCGQTGKHDCPAVQLTATEIERRDAEWKAKLASQPTPAAAAMLAVFKGAIDKVLAAIEAREKEDPGLPCPTCQRPGGHYFSTCPLKDPEPRKTAAPWKADPSSKAPIDVAKINAEIAAGRAKAEAANAKLQRAMLAEHADRLDLADKLAKAAQKALIRKHVCMGPGENEMHCARCISDCVRCRLDFELSALVLEWLLNNED